MSESAKIKSLLDEALSLLSSQLVEAGLDARVKDMRMFLHVGEYELALEELASHIGELKLPLPAHAYALMEQAGTLMEMDPTIWGELQDQIIRS